MPEILNLFIEVSFYINVKFSINIAFKCCAIKHLMYDSSTKYISKYYYFREKYHSGKNRPSDLHRMNETSLGVLLERARHAFNTTNHNTSDHDSGVTAGEVTPPVVSPIVQSYIAGLQSHAHGEGLQSYFSLLIFTKARIAILIIIITKCCHQILTVVILFVILN